MLTLLEPEIEEILKNDDAIKAKSFFDDNETAYSFVADDGWSLAALAALNSCPNILKFLISNNSLPMLDSKFKGENPALLAIEEGNSAIFKSLVKEKLIDFSDQDFSISLFNQAIKSENALSIDLVIKNLPVIDAKIIIKLAKANIDYQLKDEYVLALIKKLINIEDESNVLYDNLDIGCACVQYNCANSLNHLVENGYVFSKYNTFDDLSVISTDNRAFDSTAVLLNAGLTLSKNQILECIEYVSKNFNETLLNLLGQDPFFSLTANQNGDQNLFLASIKNKNVELQQWCINKKVNLSRTDESQNNAVILCVETGNLQLLKQLKDLGVALDQKDFNGNNAILLAVGNDDLEMCEVLLDGVDASMVGVNEANNVNIDAISLAIERKSFDILEQLLLTGPNLTFKSSTTEASSYHDSENDFELTAELIDADKFKLDGMMALKHLGFNFNIKNKHNQNLANIYARKNSGAANMALILDVGADIEEKDNDGVDAFMACVKNGSYEKIQVMLMKRNYSFEINEKTWLELLNSSTNLKGVMATLLKSSTFASSPLFVPTLKDLIDNNRDLDDWVNLSELTRKGNITQEQLNELVKYTIKKENVASFFQIVSYIDQKSSDLSMTAVFEKSSKVFKEQTQEVFDHFFKVKSPSALMLKIK